MKITDISKLAPRVQELEGLQERLEELKADLADGYTVKLNDDAVLYTLDEDEDYHDEFALHDLDLDLAALVVQAYKDKISVLEYELRQAGVEV